MRRGQIAGKQPIGAGSAIEGDGAGRQVGGGEVPFDLDGPGVRAIADDDVFDVVHIQRRVATKAIHDDRDVVVGEATGPVEELAILDDEADLIVE